jgi:hypothetical protein
MKNGAWYELSSNFSVQFVAFTATVYNEVFSCDEQYQCAVAVSVIRVSVMTSTCDNGDRDSI